MLESKHIWMALSFLQIKVRCRFILKLFIINNFDVWVRFLYFFHQHFNLPLTRSSLDQEYLVNVPIVCHEIFINEPSFDWVGWVIWLLYIEIEWWSDNRSHFGEKFQNCAWLFHFDYDFKIVCSILLPIHLSNVQSLDIVEFDFSDVWHIDNLGSLLLLAFKFLSPFHVGLILPFELFVPSFFVIM
jgi:hypothetical protein